MRDVVEMGFFEAAEKHSPEVKEEIKRIENKEWESAHDREGDVFNEHMKRKRQVMGYEQELEMEKKAFERGIVRVNIDTFIGWTDAQKIAQEKAGGLASKEEIAQSEVNTGYNTDYWMYYLTEDGKPDVIQLGNHCSNPKRYQTHLEQWGVCPWMDQARCFGDWRPIRYIYAKRDPTKNPDFIPTPIFEIKEEDKEEDKEE